MGVDRVTTRKHFARDEHDVTNFESSNFLFGNRRLEPAFLARLSEAEAVRWHSFLGHGVVTIKPSLYLKCLRVENDAQPAKGPTVIRDCHKEARRQTIDR